MNCCPDCGAPPGDLHLAGWDVELCPYCGDQAWLCGACGAPPDDRLAWTGHWPGVQEAVQLGYACLDSSEGCVPCTPDTPGAEPDLNRFLADYEWSRSGRCYVKRKSG
jgi:hypothetical protein